MLSMRFAPIFYFNCKTKTKEVRGFSKYNENRVLLEAHF